MKGNWKVGFQLSLLLITFWKEFQATKEKWKRDIVSFLIFFCSFQKLKKEKKKGGTKGNQKDLPIFSDTCATTLYSDMVMVILVVTNQVLARVEKVRFLDGFK